MKPTQKELTDWAIRRIRKDFPEDVALLVGVPGLAMDDDCHGECFDYFIPANEKGNRFAKTFIIGGVGHDLYPRSWERVEKMAELDDWFTQGLGEAVILYSRSDADRARFEAIRERLKANLADRDFMERKALEKLDVAMKIYCTMMFEESPGRIRMASGLIAEYLSLAVACVNGTYFREGLEPGTSELSRMEEVPDDFIGYYRTLIRAEDAQEIRNLSHLMIRSVRRLLAGRRNAGSRPAEAPVYEDLASWYEELSLTWRRIDRRCKDGDPDRVFADAVHLQNELSIIREEFGLRDMDLLGAYDASRLGSLAERAHGIERYILSVIEEHGVVLNRYETIEDFLKENG